MFEFYRAEFIPAYSDLVGFLLKKPRQVLTEQENALSHISQYFNPDMPSEKREENLKKSYSHLVRVTLDCYKLLLVQISKELELIYVDDKKRTFALNISEEEFLIKYNELRKTAQEARNIELVNMGNDPLVAIEEYKRAIKIGRELFEKIDKDKLRKLEGFRRIITRKGVIVSFISGLLVGLITDYIWSFLTS